MIANVTVGKKQRACFSKSQCMLTALVHVFDLRQCKGLGEAVVIDNISDICYREHGYTQLSLSQIFCTAAVLIYSEVLLCKLLQTLVIYIECCANPLRKCYISQQINSWIVYTLPHKHTKKDHFWSSFRLTE